MINLFNSNKLVRFICVFLLGRSFLKSLTWVLGSFLIAIVSSGISNPIGIIISTFLIEAEVILAIFKTGIPYALVFGAIMDAILRNGDLNKLPFTSIKIVVTMIGLIFTMSVILFFTSSDYADFEPYFLSQTSILFIVFIILLMYFKWISFYRTEEFKEKGVTKYD